MQFEKELKPKIAKKINYQIRNGDFRLNNVRFDNLRTINYLQKWRLMTCQVCTRFIQTESRRQTWISSES